MSGSVESASGYVMAGLLGLLMAWVTLAWLNDPTSDAGCDDPRMTCTPEGNRPTGFVNTTTTTPESE